jgi:hypothetical protein
MTTVINERPVLVVGSLQYLHAAPGMLQTGLWAALKTPHASRSQEQVQIIYTWLLQLKTEALLQRLRPETLYQLARHSLDASYHDTFDICTSNVLMKIIKWWFVSHHFLVLCSVSAR